MISSIRRRKRTVSIGPQSEADAREHIANREQVRRETRAANSSRSRSPKRDLQVPITEGSVLMTPDEPPTASSYLSVRPNAAGGSLKTTLQANRANVLTPPPSEASASSDEQREEEQADRKMLAAVEKPRVRYDVEVITKLVVYAGEFHTLRQKLHCRRLMVSPLFSTGIAWISLEGSPMIFPKLGLV
jgi:hypothetical protein